VCDESSVEKHKSGGKKSKTSVWQRLDEEYKHKQTEDMCGRALAVKYKSMQLEDIYAAEPLLKNAAVLRNAEAFSNYWIFSLR